MRGMLSDNKDLKVPEKPKLKCMGFTYNGVKLFNMLPLQKPKCLQNYVKRLDMEKHSFILIIFIFDRTVKQKVLGVALCFSWPSPSK